MSGVRIPVEIALDDLLEQFPSMHRTLVQDFIMRVDETMADCDFTERLRDRLDKALEAEGGPSLTSKYTDFLQWLVRMDDPLDNQGIEDRRVVTLTQIIAKARALLDGES